MPGKGIITSIHSEVEKKTEVFGELVEEALYLSREVS